MPQFPKVRHLPSKPFCGAKAWCPAKVCRNPILKHKSFLQRKSPTFGETVVRSKPKREKVPNYSALGKRCCNTAFQRFPHKLEAKHKGVSQHTCVTYQKAAQKQHAIFTNCCILFDAYSSLLRRLGHKHFSA